MCILYSELLVLIGELCSHFGKKALAENMNINESDCINNEWYMPHTKCRKTGEFKKHFFKKDHNLTNRIFSHIIHRKGLTMLNGKGISRAWSYKTCKWKEKKRTARISKQRFHFHCSAKYHSSKNPHVIKTGLFRFHLLQAIYKLQLNRAEIILHSEGTAVRAG